MKGVVRQKSALRRSRQQCAVADGAGAAERLVPQRGVEPVVVRPRQIDGRRQGGAFRLHPRLFVVALPSQIRHVPVAGGQDDGEGQGRFDAWYCGSRRGQQDGGRDGSLPRADLLRRRAPGATVNDLGESLAPGRMTERDELVQIHAAGQVHAKTHIFAVDGRGDFRHVEVEQDGQAAVRR